MIRNLSVLSNDRFSLNCVWQFGKESSEFIAKKLNIYFTWLWCPPSLTMNIIANVCFISGIAEQVLYLKRSFIFLRILSFIFNCQQVVYMLDKYYWNKQHLIFFYHGIILEILWKKKNLIRNITEILWNYWTYCRDILKIKWYISEMFRKYHGEMVKICDNIPEYWKYLRSYINNISETYFKLYIFQDCLRNMELF